MKYLLFTLCGFLLFMSCKEEESQEKWRWSYTPIIIKTSVLSQDGNRNLLNPNEDGNILSNQIKVIAEGREYYIYNLPEGMEEITEPDRNEVGFDRNFKPYLSPNYILYVWSGNPNDKWRDFEFTLDWGDGHTNQFKVTYCESESGEGLNEEILVDGETITTWNDRLFTFYR